MKRGGEPAAQPSLPVAIPHAIVDAPRVDVTADDDDREGEERLDSRIGVGAVGFVWAAFTSLMLSVAPAASGTVAAWLLVTVGAGAWSFRQWQTSLRRRPPVPLLASTTQGHDGTSDDGRASG